MAKPHQLAAPVMGSGAGLHRHQTRRLAVQERQQAVTRKLIAEHSLAGRIGSVRLENRLRDVQADGGNVSHGRLLE